MRSVQSRQRDCNGHCALRYSPAGGPHIVCQGGVAGGRAEGAGLTIHAAAARARAHEAAEGAGRPYTGQPPRSCRSPPAPHGTARREGTLGADLYHAPSRFV